MYCTVQRNPVRGRRGLMSLLLPYTFGKACLLLQLAVLTAGFGGGGRGRWRGTAEGGAVQMDLAFVIFSDFVTAHLKSQQPEAQDRWKVPESRRLVELKYFLIFYLHT